MEHSAVREELRRLHAESFGWAVCCAGDAFEAEEVLQIAYLKVLDGRAKFGGASTFKTWLFAVIRKTAADRRRWNWLRRLREGAMTPDHERPDRQPSPEQTLARRETTGQLERALGALSVRQKEVLQLTFYDGLSIAEAATVMGVSVGSARTHYERGKQSLRDRLAQDGIHDERPEQPIVVASDVPTTTPCLRGPGAGV